jgi:HAD superfamily hydrolase (TIGR01509 family)
VIAAAVFDNDGLLLDTEDAWTKAEIRLFATHGRTFTTAHKRELIGSSHLIAATKLEAMLDQPAGSGPAMVVELQVMVREVAASDGVAARPGAVELVDALVAAGVPVAVASNSERTFLDLVLASAGVADRFAVVVAGDEVPAPKPAPDGYLEACRRLGVAPGASWALEDSPTGIAAAKAAGMRVVGVPYLADLVLDADVVATSLADAVVWEALGLAR